MERETSVTSPANTLEDLYAACDPEEDLPGKDHPYYIDLSAGRGRSSVPSRIRRTINLSANSDRATRPHCKILLTGHRGTGKTTELNSLASDLQRDNYFVVRISGPAEFNLNDLGWQDLILELAYQVYEQGVAAFDEGDIKAKPNESLLRKAESWLDKTSLNEIVRINAGIEAEGKAGIKSPLPWLDLRASFKSLWKAGSERTRQVRRDLEPRATQLIQDVNAFLDDFREGLLDSDKKGLVVIIDGLEKMTLTAGEGSTNCHVDLFVNHSENLKAPNCHVIYTMPISLLYDHNLGERYPRMEPLLLPMVKVRRRDREREQNGVELMRQLLAKRAEVEKVTDPDALTELILKSGGHVRDFLRLVRAACFEAMELGHPKISLEDAKNAVNGFANEAYGKMAHEALTELYEVYQTQHLPKRHGHLAQNLLVLEYRNGESWNDIHPCLTELPNIKKALNIAVLSSDKEARMG
jgi:hypothetical protein